MILRLCLNFWVGECMREWIFLVHCLAVLEWACVAFIFHAQHKKATIHQVTTISKHILFPGHNHLLTTGTDDPTL